MNKTQNLLNSKKSSKNSLFPPITAKTTNSPLSKTKQLTVINETSEITKTPCSSPTIRENKPSKIIWNKTNRKRNDSSCQIDKTETSVETIKKRLNALKLLQHNMVKLEVNFYQDLYHLECKYAKMTKKIYDSRRKIINGEHEPSNEESDLDFLMNSNNVDTLLKEKEIIRDLAALKLTDNYKGYIKGIPEFWLTILQNASLINQMIEEYDKPILKHLIDIEVELTDLKPFSFKLKFYFEPNEYFENDVLTKTYFFKIEIDKSNPFIFEAAEPNSTVGCSINWKKDKDVTIRKDEPQESFFNYFNTNNTGVNNDEDEDDIEANIAFDYDIGYTFKEKIIPRAVLYYLGEIVEDDSDDFKLDLEQEDLSREKEEDNEN